MAPEVLLTHQQVLECEELPDTLRDAISSLTGQPNDIATRIVRILKKRGLPATREGLEEATFGVQFELPEYGNVPITLRIQVLFLGGVVCYHVTAFEKNKADDWWSHEFMETAAERYG